MSEFMENEAQGLENTPDTQAVRQEVMQELKAQPESPEQLNWKRMREENERYKREAEEYKRKLESQRGDDELVEYRQLRQLKAEMEQQTLEYRLKNKYADFDDVVNKENLQKLTEEDPELAAAIDSTPDMFTKAAAAYKMIKAKMPQVQQEFSEEDGYYIENKYKPRSSNSLAPKNGDTPLSQANAFQRGLTEDMKKKLFAEMQEAIKNRQ